MTGFAADVARFAKKANASVDAVVRKVTFDLFFEVVQRTPVDTGRLKANWQASQNVPVRGTLTSTDKDGNTTMVAIAGAIGGAGSVTYLANNLPYAHRIEFDGWSRQAPAGMVRVSMARVQRLLSAAARQHKV
ncbi:HK97 gp10 family phage protein [Caldimonas thermodepolymerans]|uniref:HK97 gp10 family phage protein n=1 Tax=Caldimonas thermodepolymerans TaxID=215580 RepID=UPI002491CCAD|nr:HK97 gp10 family phage protein [Caldimonas thermodepolymerans]